jgi:hypothetical protein
MGDIVNLNQARKARDRERARAEAAENRVKFGRSKDEKRRAAAEEALRRARLDAHRRDGGGQEPDGG